MNDFEVQLLDAIETPVFALEPDKFDRPVYVAFNTTARRAANFSTSQIVGKTAAELYSGSFGQVAYNHHCEVLSSGQAKEYELTLPLAGRNRTIRTNLKPIFDPQGRLYRLIGTSEDITNEQVVRAAQADSVVLDSELEEFVSLAAHDLRSPIRNVSTLTNMLREDLPELNSGQMMLLDKLETVAEKAMTLISDVLDHAQSTGTSQSIEDFELSDLCHDIMQMLDPVNKHSIEVEKQWLFGDRISTQVVLRNLFDNALKHNQSHAIKLSVSAQTAGTNHYQITVADDGTGFPDPTIAFLQTKNFRREHGFGLLGISRLVKARMGSISAENEPTGHGAVIKVRLPGSLQPDP